MVYLSNAFKLWVSSTLEFLAAFGRKTINNNEPNLVRYEEKKRVVSLSISLHGTLITNAIA